MQKRNQDCILSEQTMDKNLICQPEQMGGCNCLILNNIERQAGLEILPETTDEPKIWFVMRDLKRSNAHLPAYKFLESLGITCYTPMHWMLVTRGGQKKREYRPFIPDLLFVYETRKNLDAIVSKTPTLQYRFVKGGTYREAMVVPEAEMNRFMHAVGSVGNPRYYLPSEITSDMCRLRLMALCRHETSRNIKVFLYHLLTI